MSTPIRCLVIQLDRMSDTLQSLMALRAAQQLYPELEVHFVVRERFAHAIQRVPWVKSITVLPTQDLLGPFFSGEKTEEQLLPEVAKWVAPLAENGWDLTLNWSFSLASSYLTALIPSRIKLGYTRDRKSEFLAADGWSKYIQAIVQNQIPQNIHLTDILTTQLLTALQIHVGDPTGDAEASATSKTFFALSLMPHEAIQKMGKLKKKWVGIQTQSWSSDLWSCLIPQILEQNPDYGVILLGGTVDGLPKSEAVISLPDSIPFDLWAALISRCQWVISGDAAAVHLASVLGTRVLYLANQATFVEKGPYGNGHFVVQADAMTAEMVYLAWQYGNLDRIQQKQLSLSQFAEQCDLKEELQKVSVFLSRIRISSEGGGVTYDLLNPKPIEQDAWSAMVWGQIARSWYCGWVPPMGLELSRDSISPGLVHQLRVLDEASGVLGKIFEQAVATVEEIHRRSSQMKARRLMGVEDQEAIQKLGNTLREIDTLADRLVAHQPCFKGLVEMGRVLAHHTQGEDLAEMSEQSLKNYQQLLEGAKIFKAWIEFTQSLAKPVVMSMPLRAVPEPSLEPVL